MAGDWAEVTLHYETFDCKLRWEIGENALLTLTTDDERAVTSTILITDAKYVRSGQAFRPVELAGFSPYTAGNKAPGHMGIELVWNKKAAIEFRPGA